MANYLIIILITFNGEKLRILIILLPLSHYIVYPTTKPNFISEYQSYMKYSITHRSQRNASPSESTTYPTYYMWNVCYIIFCCNLFNLWYIELYDNVLILVFDHFNLFFIADNPLRKTQYVHNLRLHSFILIMTSSNQNWKKSWNVFSLHLIHNFV